MRMLCIASWFGPCGCRRAEFRARVSRVHVASVAGAGGSSGSMQNLIWASAHAWRRSMRVSTLLLVLFPVARAPHIQEYYDVTISPQYVSPSTHAYRCCTTDTLYVAVEQTPVGTTSGIGPYGMRPFKNDADVWTGVLPDMLRAMAQQTGMNLVFIEAASDCSNEIFLWDWTWAYYCTLRATNE